MAFQFTFEKLASHLQNAKDSGYQFLTCTDYVDQKCSLPPKTIVNRVDIDFSVKKTERICAIFDEVGVRGTFFVRLHAEEYNPFSFENYRILKELTSQGHEIGYHSEIIDQQEIWDETAESCLTRDVQILNDMLGIKIKGVASHGGLTGLNNLDFWSSRTASEFDLLYEAYDETDAFGLFKNSFYISDSDWYQWKCYNKGQLMEGDHRSLTEHLVDDHPLIYLLTHPDTYYDKHIYE